MIWRARLAERLSDQPQALVPSLGGLCRVGAVAGAALLDGRLYLSARGELTRYGHSGLWRPSQPPIRPVLKHGPRSLTCAQVIGLYKPKGAMKVKVSFRVA